MNNSYSISPFKGSNIADLSFVCQQAVGRVKTFLSFNITKNCFILPRKDLKVRSYVYTSFIWCEDQSETQEVIYIHMRAHALDSILLETCCIRTWYLLKAC